jgi:hypothetical protein
LATIALAEQTDIVGEACAQLIDAPESFTWPIEDPLLCMEIAFFISKYDSSISSLTPPA